MDPGTGTPLTADSLFSDWVVANYLHDPSISYGQFSYPNDHQAPQTHDTTVFKTSPFSTQTFQVHQYAVDYVDILCKGTYTLNFSSLPTVPLVPVQAFSGTYDYWSNKGASLI